MRWHYLFNPFEKYNEKQLLLAGIVFTCLGSLIACYSNHVFDGIIQVHRTTYPKSLSNCFLQVMTGTIAGSVLLFILGRVINRKTRFIDIFNTFQISRLSIYAIALVSAIPPVRNAQNRILQNIPRTNTAALKIDGPDVIAISIFGIVAIIFLAYCIVLLVNGFKTAVNTKKWQHYVLFALVLLIADFITQYLVNNFIL